MTDLLIAGAHLADGERRDLGVAGGRLVDPSELSSPERIDADGLLAVQRAGGRCFVQAPDEAASPLMPFAARRRVPGATVMGLKGIAAALAAWPD